MKLQADLFAEPEPLDEPTSDLVCEVELEPLAVPCGYKDRTNQPCSRLAHKPVMMDGYQATCRGRRLVHCAPECYNAFHDTIGKQDQ